MVKAPHTSSAAHLRLELLLLLSVGLLLAPCRAQPVDCGGLGQQVCQGVTACVDGLLPAPDNVCTSCGAIGQRPCGGAPLAH